VQGAIHRSNRNLECLGNVLDACGPKIFLFHPARVSAPSVDASKASAFSGKPAAVNSNPKYPRPAGANLAGTFTSGDIFPRFSELLSGMPLSSAGGFQRKKFRLTSLPHSR
jgi:hypothetical protein